VEFAAYEGEKLEKYRRLPLRYVMHIAVLRLTHSNWRQKLRHA